MKYAFIDDEPKNTNSSPSEESFLGTLGRGALRTGARAAESIVGAPGDINSLVSTLTGGVVPQVLPSSQTIRENVTKPLTGEYLEPQGSTEGFFDELVGALAPMIAGGPIGSVAKAAGKVPGIAKGVSSLVKNAPKLAKGAEIAGKALYGSTPLKRALPIAGAGIGAGKTAGALGAPEWAQGLASLGASGAASLLSHAGGTKSIHKAALEQYNLADSLIESLPRDKKSVSISPIRGSLDALRKDLSRGNPGAVEKQIVQYIDSIENKAKRGRIPIEELVALKRQLNRDIGDPAKLHGVEKLLGSVKNKVTDLIHNEYGKTNPEFSRAIKTGDELFAGVQRAKQASSFLDKHANLKMVLPLGIYSLLTNPVGTAKAAAVGVPLIAASGAASRGISYLRNPSIRKYYKGFLDAASKDSLPAATIAAKNLKKVVDRAEKNGDIEPYSEESTSQSLPVRYRFID